VVKANQIGAVVISRDVLEHPEKAQGPADFGYGPGEEEVAIYLLIVIMALLEVVLLAGPSFAVGARRMQGQLAIVSANGGTPRQTRRAVMAMGAVVGALASALGVLIGVPLGWALSPVLQHWSTEWFGPLDVPWLHLVGIAGFGFISALLAAIVPAWIASRQDVVQVLAGRRGDRKPTPASPILGVILIGIGLALTANGVKGPSSGMGETWIGFGAVFAVLGTVLLVPVFLAVVGKFASRATLPIRYAVRDAARHRTRTVPAIGAALASVAGVVALGIAVSSDEAGNKASWEPRADMGTGVVQYYGGGPGQETSATWKAVLAATTAQFPKAEVLTGIDQGNSSNEPYTSAYLGQPGKGPLQKSYMSYLGPGQVVADKLPKLDLGVPAAARAGVDRALAAGQVVAFTDHPVSGHTVLVNLETWRPAEEQDQPESRQVTVPAYFVEIDGSAKAEAIFPTAAVKKLGLKASPAGIVIDQQVSTAQQQDLSEALNAISEEASVYVERGYQRDAMYGVMLAILVGLGSLLMLGGTLTATFLALSDAKPDLATLAAVGAAPRTRRVVAGAYALVIGGIGAVLGAVVGFVPGLAATWPLTANSWSPDGGSTHTVDIPWLLILGVVVGLPVLTAVVVGGFAKSRLPVVARID
jgi:putative ABC transport system permease protein